MLFEGMMGKNRKDTIGNDLCMTCDARQLPEWRDHLSVQEYRISGMCQTCQDQVFSADEGEYDAS